MRGLRGERGGGVRGRKENGKEGAIGVLRSIEYRPLVAAKESNREGAGLKGTDRCR